MDTGWETRQHLPEGAPSPQQLDSNTGQANGVLSFLLPFSQAAPRTEALRRWPLLGESEALRGSLFPDLKLTVLWSAQNSPSFLEASCSFAYNLHVK